MIQKSLDKILQPPAAESKIHNTVQEVLVNSVAQNEIKIWVINNN